MTIEFVTAGFDAIALVRRLQIVVATATAKQKQRKVVVSGASDQAQIKFVLNCIELVMDARTTTIHI